MDAYKFLIPETQSTGYWGPVTSTIDWCELNHTHSYHIAEWINTLSNIPPALIGLYAYFANVAAGTPRLYALLHLHHALVFIGSFAFHGTLKWESQLMDELPMLYCISYGIYIVFDLPTVMGGWVSALALAAWDIFITAAYLRFPFPIAFQVVFTILLLIVFFGSVALVFKLPKEHRVRRDTTHTVWVGSVFCVVAFVCWNIDNHLCHMLRELRDSLAEAGYGALGNLTQGHGWWHLLMGYGSFLIYTAITELCLAVKTSPDDWTYDASAIIPVVRPVAAKDKVHEPITTNGKN